MSTRESHFGITKPSAARQVDPPKPTISTESTVVKVKNPITQPQGVRFSDFVKFNHHLVKNLPSKERMKALSAMFKGTSPTELLKEPINEELFKSHPKRAPRNTQSVVVAPSNITTRAHRAG